MAFDFVPKIVYGSSPTTILFTYPPSGDPLNEELQSIGSGSISASGEEQFSQLRIEEVIELEFKMLTKTQIDALRTFFKNHASLGSEFKYYVHNSEATYETYRLNKKIFAPKRTSPNGSNDFLYSLKLEFRRVA